MNADLEQIADEAIDARHAYITAEGCTGDADLDVARRAAAAALWRHLRPALDQLAEDRLTALARMETRGVLPEPNCDVSVADVHLLAVRNGPPLRHRYAVLRGPGVDLVGIVWLSSDPHTRGDYHAVLTGQPGGVWGHNLPSALRLLAGRVNDGARIQRAGQRGDVQ